MFHKSLSAPPALRGEGIARHRVRLYSVLFALLVATVGTAFVCQWQDHRRTMERKHLLEIAVQEAYVIDRTLSTALSAARGLASIIEAFGEISNFEKIAADMLQQYGGISSLQLAPGGIVKKIYPLKGNEDILGHNLLLDPQKGPEAMKTLEARSLTLAGPYKLADGKEAVVGWFPVFLNRGTEREKFWGFTAVIVRMDDLMAQLNLDALVRSGHDYQLSRINSSTGRSDTFARSRPDALRNGVSVDVKIPNGLWTLTLAPQDSFAAGFPLSSMMAVLLVSIVMGFAVHALLRQPEILREKVDSATAELLALNARLEEEIGERKRIQADLEKSRSELEQRVAERTQELQQTNRQLASEIEDRKQAEEALRESEQKYHELSITDSLTGLFNTRHFYAQLRAEIDRALRYTRPLSLLLLDIDDFKVYNDTFGHMEGDDVLIRLADVLRGSMRVTDSAYRYGGEEFCIILPETDGPNGLTIANRIRESFRNEVFSPNKAREVFVTVSVGVAQFETEESLESFLRRADGNMYRAKKAGKDQVFFG